MASRPRRKGWGDLDEVSGTIELAKEAVVAERRNPLIAELLNEERVLCGYSEDTDPSAVQQSPLVLLPTFLAVLVAGWFDSAGPVVATPQRPARVAEPAPSAPSPQGAAGRCGASCPRRRSNGRRGPSVRHAVLPRRRLYGSGGASA